MILATGSGYRELGLPDEKRLSGRGVSLVRHLRRLLLPRPGHRGRRRRRLRDGGGHVPTRFARSVTVVHRRDSLRASKIMQDRAFANDKIRFALEQRGRRRSSATTRLDRRAAARPVRPARSASSPVTGLFVAIGHDPRTSCSHGQVDLDDEGYVLVERPHPPAPTCPASSPAATSSTTPTGRPSPRPAPAAPRPSTPSATSPTSRTSARRRQRSPPASV